MKLIVNGEEKVTDVTTVRGLVVELGLGEQPVAVEVNKVVVPRREHEAKELNEGDVVELVTLVGGG
ncbi:sulfur carrier protein ThiS [Poriferisphaera corsica]|uniref:Sulfur carrier protein ThiS n=1 Tax=Poriferisphaera corsica TaxID=2528020 RepID=A0A517YWK3_9BACT|nr:sulfur carrier protein ThiS [Poriferisphaera corsica]QDU34611.1 sulfur carrier protein ThiS [Poriferisphaera corsica]